MDAIAKGLSPQVSKGLSLQVFHGFNLLRQNNPHRAKQTRFK